MTPIHPYHALKAALTLYGKDCMTLSSEERVEATRVARRHADIEAAVLSSADARGVCLSPGAVDSALAEVKARFEDEAAFHSGLANAGMDEEHFMEALQRDLLVDAIMERVGTRAGEVGTTEAEIFYYTHVDRFRTEEQRTARHILITVNDAFSDNTLQRASQRVTEIAARLASRPERFEEQAMKHSECPTALNGGLLGKVTRGQLYPELDKVLFELDEGALSAPVRSELG
ncbi:MAG: peptidylprolyl isomerase, partial [Rhodocyclaceae bacterium]|nr:peptidylprolyl isomerase [Rhodocyclaceae bacterium]